MRLNCFIIILSLLAQSATADGSGFKLNGFCQNLVINSSDITGRCAKESQRMDLENGRVNYIFWARNPGTMLVFAGYDEVTEAGRYYSYVKVDRIYVNNQLYSIDGVCSLLGNIDLGVTVSCHSNDNNEKFSALFFSVSSNEIK